MKTVRRFNNGKLMVLGERYGRNSNSMNYCDFYIQRTQKSIIMQNERAVDWGFRARTFNVTELNDELKCHSASKR